MRIGDSRLDTVLLIGSTDEKLKAFLIRMGYDVLVESDGKTLKDIIPRAVIDLIVVDTRTEKEPLPLCEFLRKNDLTKDTPIVLLSAARLYPLQIRDQGLDKVECIDIPYTIGSVVSKIATQLRLRKMSGANDRTATLSEMNAALRDLNQRFQKELEEARAIQAALLPTELPKGEGFDVAAVYRPLEQVGGDWYFVNQGKSGKLSFLVADVTGHGLSAAFIGSMTKLALTASGSEVPSELLSAMNTLMAPQLPQGRFVTASSFLFDPKSGELEFARGGAPAALHFDRKGGKIHELKGDGFPLGFFDQSEYSSEKTSMNTGDILAVVTDGITEAQNRKSEMYGSDRVGKILMESSKDDSAQVVLDRIIEGFQTFLDGRILKDDVTILVLKRT